MPQEIRIGMLLKSDDSGLGSLSQDFYKFLKPTKVLTIMGGYDNHPERFPNGVICEMGVPTLEQIEEFLKDIDVVLTFETPYNWTLISEAKKRGIKTIIIPNYEWSVANPPVEPDLWLCPSKLDYNIFKEEGRKVEYLPIPIDRTKIQFKLRTKAHTFVFNNGHGGSIGRNSAREMIEAIARTKSDVKFIVRSQVMVDNTVDDMKTKFLLGEGNKSTLFEEGDVFVFPHKFDGLSLPIQEAMAAGMPIITTDFFPFNEMLPKELLFAPDDVGKAKLCEDCRNIDLHFIYPKLLAQKIDEWANKDITKYSLEMNRMAESISWDIMLPKYKEIIKKVCQEK
jgi:glycosyltransferase involved in cell wall biosynthesis